MSKNLLNNKYYLELLLSTSKDQALALLHTITKDQLLLIGEIAKNILNLPLPKKAQHYVNRKKKLFQSLAGKKISGARKLRSLQKNAKYILQVLLSLKAQLNELQ